MLLRVKIAAIWPGWAETAGAVNQLGVVRWHCLRALNLHWNYWFTQKTLIWTASYLN